MYARDDALIATPIGMIRVKGDDHAISSVSIEADIADPLPGKTIAVRLAVQQLSEYFAGTRWRFDVRLAPAKTARGTALRDGMSAIEYGDMLSYGDLARVLASSPRAVGQACARNPFPIIVPCHRVTGSNGALGHYSAGEGRATKLWLLDHERLHQEIKA